MEKKPQKLTECLKTERGLLRDYLKGKVEFNTDIKRLRGKRKVINEVGIGRFGRFRPIESRMIITADLDIQNKFIRAGKKIPVFYEAGPRRELYFNYHKVKAAIVTAGGLAPGMNAVIHGIVSRHFATYKLNTNARGSILGIHNSFPGLNTSNFNAERLTVEKTYKHLFEGGSFLGGMRDDKTNIDNKAKRIVMNLKSKRINILYVIGGDGSLYMAHKLAHYAYKHNISVVGIPKTMDNDILWVWQSFGFRTAVKQATEVVNVLHCEAKSTQRVGVIQLFGAKSGFVAANAALASGHVNLVLIPEQFLKLNKKKSKAGLLKLLKWFIDVRENRAGEDPPRHGIVVLAEGVGEILNEKKVSLRIYDPKKKKMVTRLITKKNVKEVIRSYIEYRAVKKHSQIKGTFDNEPRHYIRATPPNAQDQIYCERLGALAVDNALAGFTDFMVSQWLTEYVMVPLEMATIGQKCVPTDGLFWKQVISSTEQPSICPQSGK